MFYAEGYRGSKTTDEKTVKYLYEYDKIIKEVDSANGEYGGADWTVGAARLDTCGGMVGYPEKGL